MTRQAASRTTKTIVEGTVYSSAGNFLMRVLSFFGFSITVAALSLHDYGIVTLLLSFLTPAIAVGLFGFDRIFVSTVARLRGEGKIAEARSLIREYFLVVLALACAFATGAYWLREYLVRYYDIYLVNYFFYVMLVIGAQLAFNAIQLVLEGFERLKQLSFLQFIESLVRNAAVIIFARELDIGSLLLIHVVAKTTAATAGVWSARSIFRELRGVGDRVRGALLRLVRREGKWEIFRNIAVQLLAPLQVWLVKVFVNVEGVAVFDFARKIYSFIVDALPIKSVIFPIISRTIGDKYYSRIIVVKAKKYTMLFYAVAYILCVALLPFAIGMFFSAYRGHLLLIYFALLHIFVDGYKIGQSALLYAYNQQRFQFFMFYVNIAIQIVSDIVFVWAFGVFGILLSWHFNSLALGIMINRHLKRNLDINISDPKEYITFDEHDRLFLQRLWLQVGRIRKKMTR